MPGQRYEDIPDSADDAPILSHFSERELLKVEALSELQVDDDEATTAARALVADRQDMLARTQEAREVADVQALVARDTLQSLVEARLRGEPDPAEADVRRQAAEVSIELDTLTTLEIKIGRELKEAQAALAQAILENKLQVTRERWAILADEQRQVCIRLSKSLREVRSWWDKLRDGATGMEEMSAVLGNPLSWHQAERRILVNHLRAGIFGLVPEAQFVSGGQREIADTPLAKIWPFAQPINGADAPAEGEER